MKVKICGIKKEKEIDYLNEAKPDYAGFVLYEKSKRFISVENAAHLMRALSREILRVAVTVHPSDALISEIEAAGFDLIQIHGDFSDQQISRISIPVWRAYNSEHPDSLQITEHHPNIRGYVIDAAKAGSGVTSHWEEGFDREKLWQKLDRRDFILAGGLNPENVEEGIRIFAPDILDVSSGVEGEDGKDREKIRSFIRKARGNEE